MRITMTLIIALLSGCTNHPQDEAESMVALSLVKISMIRVNSGDNSERDTCHAKLRAIAAEYDAAHTDVQRDVWRDAYDYTQSECHQW